VRRTFRRYIRKTLSQNIPPVLQDLKSFTDDIEIPFDKFKQRIQ
jgi:hypothetical protein